MRDVADTGPEAHIQVPPAHRLIKSMRAVDSSNFSSVCATKEASHKPARKYCSGASTWQPEAVHTHRHTLSQSHTHAQEPVNTPPQATSLPSRQRITQQSSQRKNRGNPPMGGTCDCEPQHKPSSTHSGVKVSGSHSLQSRRAIAHPHSAPGGTAKLRALLASTPRAGRSRGSCKRPSS
jgi:hypothetical protein